MLIYVPLNHIDDNPYQRRAEYGDIEELAERIHLAKASYPETLGLMQVPRGRIVVVDTDRRKRTDCIRDFISGTRWSWRQFRARGWECIKVRIVPVSEEAIHD